MESAEMQFSTLEKNKKNNMAKTLNVNTFLNKKFQLLPFTGDWKNSFGEPCKQFSMMIYGSSGNGKTELAMQLAKYLTQYGKVAYNSIEEGDSHTLQMTVARNNMEQVADKFQIITGENFTELSKRLKKQRSPDFIIIDSVQYLNGTKEEYFEFKKNFYPKKGIIYISHVDGKDLDSVKGALAKSIWYDVDIQVPVKGFKAFPKKRLNGGGEEFIINHERAAKFWGEIK